MILVTGAQGFLGRHLIPALIQKWGADQVMALTSAPVYSGGAWLQHHNYDFSPDYFVRSGFESIHTIIHAGAYIPKSSKDGKDWQACNRNIVTTERLLTAQLPSLKRLIFISTVDVYGPAEIVSEKTAVQPVSLYGLSKYYCEQMLEAWAEEQNKTIQILRVGHIYGPGEEQYQKLIPVTMRKLLQRESLQLWGEGTEERAFIYVSDVVNAIISACGYETYLKPVNVAGKRAVTVKKLMDLLIGMAEYSPIIERQSFNGPGRSIRFDVSRMEEILGPERVSLEDGLRSEWEYMKEVK